MGEREMMHPAFLRRDQRFTVVESGTAVAARVMAGTWVYIHGAVSGDGSMHLKAAHALTGSDVHLRLGPDALVEVRR